MSLGSKSVLCVPVRLAAALLVWAAPAFSQQTWYVDADGQPPGSGSINDPYTSIQFAIDQGTTLTEDRLLVADGTYLERIDFQGKALSIEALGAGPVTLDGQDLGTVVSARNGEPSGTRLVGLTLIGGRGTSVNGEQWGGGVLVQNASLEMIDCVVRDCIANRGAGALVEQGTLSLQGCSFLSNEARTGFNGGLGGGVYVGSAGQATLDACTTESNLAWRGGGLAVDGGFVEVLGGLIADNFGCQNSPSGSIAASRGGGVWLGAGTLDLLDVVIAGNKLLGAPGACSGTTGFGGGICVEDGTLSATGCTINDNSTTFNGSGGFGASAGGGLAVFGGEVVLDGCGFENNRTAEFGGGIFGPVEADNCVLFDNESWAGGGIWGPGSVLRNCQIIDNRGFPGDGSGSFAGGAFGCTLIDCLISGNRGAVGAGALECTLVNCDVVENRCSGNGDFAFRGAGIADSTATNCRIENNTAIGDGTAGSVTRGGGADNSTLMDCIVRGNRILGSGVLTELLGGGAAGCTLHRCLVEDNLVSTTAPFNNNGHGGGLWDSVAFHCVIANNRAESTDDFFPGSPSGGGAAGSTLERCLLLDNSAVQGGGAWDSTLLYCTLVGNAAEEVGSAVATRGQTPSDPPRASILEGCIVLGAPSNLFEDGADELSVDFSLVEGGWPGTQNFDGNPLFFGPASGDYHLRLGSPCIDTGNPFGTVMDPDGSIPDLGALPYDPTWFGKTKAWCEAKTDSAACTPSITWTGTPSVSGPDDFVIQAQALPVGSFGVLVAALEFRQVPLGSGTLCLRPPFLRLGGTVSVGAGLCQGAFSMALSQARLGQLGLGAGDRLYTQWWYRDFSAADGTGLGMTDALEIILQP